MMNMLKYVCKESNVKSLWNTGIENHMNILITLQIMVYPQDRTVYVQIQKDLKIFEWKNEAVEHVGSILEKMKLDLISLYRSTPIYLSENCKDL